MLYNGVDTSIAKSRYTTLLPTLICTTGTFLQFWCLGRVYPFIHERLENCFQRNGLNLGGEKTDAFRVSSGIFNNYSSRANGLLTQRP